MQQLASVWSGLDMRRRIILVTATLGMFAAVLMLAQSASQPRMALLYAGLDPSAAGEVVEALEARGATIDIRGTAIYVDAAQRDALRLALAGEGLPQNGGQGYELLDALNGFGTTAQMFDATYWRAKEGELARTITSNRQFKAARVHISNPANDPFRQGQVDAASVTVTMASGQLTTSQATALRYLVSSAVAGLDADQVAIIDSDAGLISAADDPTSRASGASDARAEALKLAVTRLLEARVGKGRAIVEVTIDPVTEREEITERRFDPESRVPISSDSEEVTTRSTDSRSGNVTVASNLPDGDAGGTSGSAESSESRSRELLNFEVSETQRALLREPGGVRRLSVAVLVDGVRSTTQDGTLEWQPRPEPELQDLRELVASAVGFSDERGDQLTIRSMELQSVAEAEPPLPPSFFERSGLDTMSLVQIGALALVSLILGLFVLRPILLAPPRPSAPQLAPPTSSQFDTDLPALDGQIDLGGDDFQPLDLPAFSEMPAIGEDPAARLRDLIEQKQDETVEILGQWMNDAEEAPR